jgi:hypothetical protein
VTRIFGILIALLLAGPARAAELFDTIRCGMDIPNAMIGQRQPNTSIGHLEQRYKSIDLEVIGGFGLTDMLSLTYWRICGTEYVVLTTDKQITDAVAFPPRAKNAPDLVGSCLRGGQKIPETVVALLNNPNGLKRTNTAQDERTFLPAQAAWKIDEKRRKFVKLEVGGLTCPLSDVLGQN